MENFHELEEYELSDKDLKKLLGNVNIIPYPQLAYYDNIDECFGSKNFFIMFFETISESVGHWCLFLKFPNKKIIEFWDPLGIAPDGERSYVSHGTLKKLDETQPEVQLLLERAEEQGYSSIFNTTDYQNWSTSTCGKHCTVRALNSHLSESQYFSFMKNYMMKNNLHDFDEVVCDIVYKKIGK